MCRTGSGQAGWVGTMPWLGNTTFLEYSSYPTDCNAKEDAEVDNVQRKLHCFLPEKELLSNARQAKTENDPPETPVKVEVATKLRNRANVAIDGVKLRGNHRDEEPRDERVNDRENH